MAKNSKSILVRMNEETYKKVQRAKEIFAKRGEKPISNAEAIRRLMKEGADPLINKQLASVDRNLG